MAKICPHKEINTMKNELSGISTEALAAELSTRKDLVGSGGFLSNAAYSLSTELCIMPCVDGIAIRRRNDKIEALAIRRNTGPFTNKLCSIGGRILFEESYEQALRRHFKTDLDVKIEFLTPWDQPATVYQFMRPLNDGGVLPDFGVEISRRHCITSVYIVKLQTDALSFGSSKMGLQEVQGVEWFSVDNIPPPHEFGYGQDVYFRKCLELAERMF